MQTDRGREGGREGGEGGGRGAREISRKKTHLAVPLLCGAGAALLAGRVPQERRWQSVLDERVELVHIDVGISTAVYVVLAGGSELVPQGIDVLIRELHAVLVLQEELEAALCPQCSLQTVANEESPT